MHRHQPRQWVHDFTHVLIEEAANYVTLDCLLHYDDLEQIRLSVTAHLTRAHSHNTYSTVEEDRHVFAVELNLGSTHDLFDQLLVIRSLQFLKAPEEGLTPKQGPYALGVDLEVERLRRIVIVVIDQFLYSVATLVDECANAETR